MSTYCVNHSFCMTSFNPPPPIEMRSGLRSLKEVAQGPWAAGGGERQ